MPIRYSSKAPGRICLFGDHQDYLQLPVIACAINRYLEIQATPNEKNLLLIRKEDLNEEECIAIDAPLGTVANGDYLRLALKVLARYGCRPNSGFDISIAGDVPINAGLSSSSALTVAWIQFLIQTFGIDEPITPALMARLAYETEVIEQGSSGGKMDQYTISYGELIYLDTATDVVEQLSQPIEGLVIGVSGVAKDTYGTLSSLKDRALQSIAQVQLKVPDFKIANSVKEDANKYVAHVEPALQKVFGAAVLNYEITRKAKAALLQPSIDPMLIGGLMNAHHALLKDNLKITVPLIDDMIDAANQAGALGAKIVGSGGGGCIVAICPTNGEAAVIAAIKAAGAADAFAVKQSGGASFSKVNC